MGDEDKEIPEPKETEPKKPEGTPESGSIVDEARAIRDEIVKAKEDLKIENDRKDKLNADELLSSSAGKRVETPQVSEAEKKQKGAEEFFEGTALGDTIKKANE